MVLNWMRCEKGVKEGYSLVTMKDVGALIDNED
jgi:hypothetical protein